MDIGTEVKMDTEITITSQEKDDANCLR